MAEQEQAAIQSQPKPKDPTFASVLSRRSIRALWIASLISYIGDTFSLMALFILISDVTKSTSALAAIGIAQSIPVFFGVALGALVDRWRYRPILLIADLARAALIPLYMLAGSADNLWVVLLATLVAALASRFFSPASQALRRALLRPEEYKVAASIWQGTLGISYMVGPALAGFTISAFGGGRSGTTIAFIIDSLSFLISAVIIFIGVRREAEAIDAARASEERVSTWQDLLAGWGVMRRSRAIKGVLVLYSVGLLGVGAVLVLAVPFVQRVLGGGPFEIGLLDTSQAFGLAIGAVVVGSVLASRVPAGTMMVAASVLGGISVIGLGLSPFYIAALIIMILAGIAAGTVETAGSAVMLHEVPQKHQAKANATLDTVLQATYVISVAFAGLAGDSIGIRQTFLLGGTIALLAAIFAAPLLLGAVKPNEDTGVDSNQVANSEAQDEVSIYEASLSET